MFYEERYRVDSRDIDPQGICRPSALLGYLQEAATNAAMALHVSRDEMIANYNAFWMMARIWYRLDRPLGWNEELTIRTWHRGDKGASMYRDFDLLQNGKPVGEAVSVWVLADMDTHQLFRLNKVKEFAGTSGDALCKTKLLPKLRVPSPLPFAEERTLHYSDADVNGHVNNVRYADFACDAIHMETLGVGQYVSALQVGYLAECMPGEHILLSAGCDDGVWYIAGKDKAEKSRFDAAVTLSPI